MRVLCGGYRPVSLPPWPQVSNDAPNTESRYRAYHSCFLRVFYKQNTYLHNSSHCLFDCEKMSLNVFVCNWMKNVRHIKLIILSETLQFNTERGIIQMKIDCLFPTHLIHYKSGYIHSSHINKAQIIATNIISSAQLISSKFNI